MVKMLLQNQFLQNQSQQKQLLIIRQVVLQARAVSTQVLQQVKNQEDISSLCVRTGTHLVMQQHVLTGGMVQINVLTGSIHIS